MEYGIAANIYTHFGEICLIPQDRNLLQVSSIEPLQIRGVKIHLWAMLQRTEKLWLISPLAEPMLRLAHRSGDLSSIPDKSIAAELIKSITLSAGEWAAERPDAFKRAAAESFELDKQGLDRELAGLKESLTCSAQAIDSITSEAPSENSARLREYSQTMRGIAFDVPAMRKLTRAIPYPYRDSRQRASLQPVALRDPKATDAEPQLRDVSRSRKHSNNSTDTGAEASHQGPSIGPPTLASVLKHRRIEIGLSQRDLALKLGLKTGLVAQLETDWRRRPSFQLLAHVAGILGLEKDRLFQLAEDKTIKSSSGGLRAVSRPKGEAGAFGRNRALLGSHNVTPRELKVLSQVSLMGTIKGSNALLFILDALRDCDESDE
jgi:transcriptional regulator with XRE-family HTH domain